MHSLPCDTLYPITRDLFSAWVVDHSDRFHDRYILIDNAELHNLGSSINYLGCRVTNYSTSDPREIKKLQALLQP